VPIERWMMNAEFLDGLALWRILPAPLMIFGYFGAGVLGAVAITAAMFAPAFEFTLVRTSSSAHRRAAGGESEDSS
jgi:hypothetical protein